MKRICILILVLLWAWSVMGSNGGAGDSVGVKTMNGRSYIVYRISPSETAYAVSRKYNIPFKELEVANTGLDLGALKMGQEILVPRIGSVMTTQSADPQEVQEAQTAQTTMSVKEEPKNDPQTETKEDVPEPPQEHMNADANILASTDLQDEPTIPNTAKGKTFAQAYADYYGTDMYQRSEKGVATWIDASGIETSGDRFYALHNTAPIGSIVKVRNMMNNRVIYAKVIGTLSDSEVQEKVLIKLSAGAGERLNVLDSRFVVEISWYSAGDKAEN
ncbi:MAG: hypothetical protein R2794_06650 [Chitinophagales bacterium]